MFDRPVRGVDRLGSSDTATSSCTSNLLGLVLVGPNIALVYDDHSPSGIFPLADS
jgi:hypothetical protein